MTKIVFHFYNLTSPIVKFKRNPSRVPVQAKYCFVSSSINNRVIREMASIWSQDSDRVPSKAQQMSNIADKINFHLSFGGTRTPVCLSSFTWERFRSHFRLDLVLGLEWDVGFWKKMCDIQPEWPGCTRTYASLWCNAKCKMLFTSFSKM